MKAFVISLTVLLLSATATQAAEWTFLNVNRTGAASFISENPAYDGSGVVIIVLDTGIDMGVAGLMHTPDDEIKVIDVQDFSGEGDVYYDVAEPGEENNEQYLEYPEGVKLFGYDKLQFKPVDGRYYMGVLRERQFLNSSVHDLNNNGLLEDDYAFIVMDTEKEGWLTYVDLDADGNIDDEEPLWDYKKELQWFQFRGRNQERSRNLANFGLNIFPEDKRVVFHYDGSGHGTHVAGIAAGYRINGQEGLNGVAPGAKLISLKIGDTQLSGGATTTGSMLKAYEYGVDFAKEYDGPVVFNMSFGIGSEIEGQSDMDYMINRFLEENEEILICTSAGNEGPGISTVGLPAAASRALSVGALQTRETARDVYGVNLPTDRIFYFSSRGGELPKPDIVAPGAASATIPPFSTSENKWGTSMASPQAAGAVALLMSAAHQQEPPLPVDGALLKKALKNSADYLRDYTPVDQGSGVIRIPAAFEFYKRYIEREDHKTVRNYDISTLSPVYESEQGPAAYWRFGTSFPDTEDKQRFYINALFPEDFDADVRYEFYRAFDLESGEPWLKLSKQSTYIKGTDAATVDIYFDQSKMKRPGLYSGKVRAYRKGGLFSGNKPVDREFELFVTAVVPVTFDQDNNYTWKSEEYKLNQGELERVFFEIPLEASSCTINLEQPQDKFTNVRAYLFDPKGREKSWLVVNSERTDERSFYITSDVLEPGVWELVLYGDYRNERTSHVSAEISFSGLEAYPKTVSHLRIRNGFNPEGSLEIINHYSEELETRINGKIYGYQRVQRLNESSDLWEYSFKVGDDIDRVVFELEVEPEVFNMFTDFAISIKNYQGEVLEKDALTYRKGKITFMVPESDSYILQLVPAFAMKEVPEWQATLTESYYKFKQQDIIGSMATFYPKIRKDVEFEIDGTLPVAPDDFYVFGELWFTSTAARKYRVTIPVKLYTGMN